MNPTISTRRHDIDWLRTLAILAVFVFHSGRFFDLGGWHVKNAQTYFGAQVWTVFLVNWMMPLIFVISGAGAFYALGSRGAGKFLKDRALRLLVPLVVGIFTHIALQVYLERLTHGQFRGSFFAFLPHYFDGMYGFGGNFAWMGLHLWYLEVLFVFSLMCLPLLLWLKRGLGARLLAALTRPLARPGAAYLLALPTMLLLSVLDPDTPLGLREFGGWSLVLYILFFVSGFVLVSDAGVERAVRRQRWISLVAGLALVIALFLLLAGRSDPVFGTPRFRLFTWLFGLSSWCWILAIWGFGTQHLTAKTPLLAYTNEAVLPFYVMHQTVLLAVGYFVVQSAIPDLLKFLVISAGSFAVIAAMYEFLVRRHNLLRFLFGMKPLRRATQPAAPATAPQAAR